jgi:hypothetical protein
VYLYYLWLSLPLLAALPALARLRALRAARRRALVRGRAWPWLLAGLAAAQLIPWLALLSVHYPTRPELPLAALALAGVMLIAARAARPGVHPALRGLERRLPTDGLALIEEERRRASRAGRLARPSGLGLTVLPALAALIVVIGAAPARVIDLGLAVLLMAAPLALVPYRWQWLLPVWLFLPLSVMSARAFTAQAGLPPGWWAQPVAGAPCAGQVRPVPGQPRAWCVGANRAVYYFDPRSGRVLGQWPVTEAARPFAVAGDFAYIQQSPASGLVRLTTSGEQERVSVLAPQNGAADATGRLWIVDFGPELFLFAPGEAPRPQRRADGLLNNTANVVRVSPAGDVWVGSAGGASVLPAGSSAWETHEVPAGVPVAVINFAFGLEGTVWMLWQPRPGYLGPNAWAVSGLHPGGGWTHLPLGPDTGLDVPLAEDALAATGDGRLWFVSQSIPARERYLGVVTPGAAPRIYSLGPFPYSGPWAYGSGLWRDTYGVIPDGAGGVLVYAGPEAPWRRLQ